MTSTNSTSFDTAGLPKCQLSAPPLLDAHQAPPGPPSPEKNAGGGNRLLQELAKLRDDDDKSPTLGIGASKSIARRRETIDPASSSTMRRLLTGNPHPPSTPSEGSPGSASPRPPPPRTPLPPGMEHPDASSPPAAAASPASPASPASFVRSGRYSSFLDRAINTNITNSSGGSGDATPSHSDTASGGATPAPFASSHHAPAVGVSSPSPASPLGAGPVSPGPYNALLQQRAGGGPLQPRLSGSGATAGGTAAYIRRSSGSGATLASPQGTPPPGSGLPSPVWQNSAVRRSLPAAPSDASEPLPVLSSLSAGQQAPNAMRRSIGGGIAEALAAAVAAGAADRPASGRSLMRRASANGANPGAGARAESLVAVTGGGGPATFTAGSRSSSMSGQRGGGGESLMAVAAAGAAAAATAGPRSTSMSGQRALSRRASANGTTPGAVRAAGLSNPRRVSGTISAEGAALIKKLNELDANYGLAEDGSTRLASLTLNQAEEFRVQTGRAATPGPPALSAEPPAGGPGTRALWHTASFSPVLGAPTSFSRRAAAEALRASADDADWKTYT